MNRKKVQRAEAVNDVWCWDFNLDTTEGSECLKILSILDEFNRFCITMDVARKLNDDSVERLFDRVCKAYGTPKHIRSDNGSEFVASSIRKWTKARKVDSVYIEPGSPWQNVYVESFHSRPRADLPKQGTANYLLDAQVGVANWHKKYNDYRMHSGQTAKL